MKALSIRQPWAFAIAHGFKPVENRVWRTTHRGTVLIHAGKTEEADDVGFVLDLISFQTGKRRDEVDHHYREHRHFDAIVGAAALVDCVTAMDDPWFFGPFGFVFADPAPLPPMPCRGMPGLFAVPADVLSKIRLLPRDTLAEVARGVDDEVVWDKPQNEGNHG